MPSRSGSLGIAPKFVGHQIKGPRSGPSLVVAYPRRLDFSPQFVAYGPGRSSAQLVADHDALDGVGHDSAERTPAHAHRYHAVARRCTADSTIKLT